MRQKASDSADNIHGDALSDAGFKEVPSPPGFESPWQAYAIENEGMHGHFYTCAPKKSWQISIHDFTLANDMMLEFEGQDYISVGWYESISGEQFNPYRRLRPSTLWGFDTKGGWRGLTHGGIPVRCISIEIRPELLERFIRDGYWNSYEEVSATLLCVNEGAALPELRALLEGLWPRPSGERRSPLYLEGKVIEAVGLLVEHSTAKVPRLSRKVPDPDRERIREVTTYIDDHCSSNLQLADLARAACMSPTKFKECFKAVTGSTLTAYVQSRRMSMAESLLRRSDLTVAQVSRAVGYTCTSRFSSLFRRETGMLPSELRKVLR